jgi:uncharacterized protein
MREDVISTLGAIALRLGPGDDLIDSIMAVARARSIAAGCVITCVGSLERAVIRLADQEQWTVFDRKFEIVALTGTFSAAGGHFHLAVADREGRTIGGHIASGCLVYTTAEIVLGILPDARFDRERDSQTGYDELTVRRVD